MAAVADADQRVRLNILSNVGEPCGGVLFLATVKLLMRRLGRIPQPKLAI